MNIIIEKIKKEENVIFELSLLILFISILFCWSNTSYVLIGIGAICFLQGLIRIKEISLRQLLDIRIILLILGLTSLRWIGFTRDLSMIVNVFVPCLFFLFPILFLDGYSNEMKVYRTKRIIYTLAYGGLFETILSIAAFCRFKMEINRYDLLNIWESYYYKILARATNYEFFVIMIVGLLSYGIYILICKKQIQGLLVILLSSATVYLFFSVLQERSLLIICLINLFSCFCVITCSHYKNLKVRITFYSVIVLITILICVILYMYNNNIFDLYEKVNNSFLGRDGGIIGNIRFQAQRKVILQMPQYLWGKERMDICGLSAVHNYWLDIYYVAGIIPFVFVSILSLIFLVDVIKMCLNKNNNMEIKLVLFGCWITMFLYMWIESIVKGSCIPPAVFFLINGCVCSINKKTN